jgi:hypothetical protein
MSDDHEKPAMSEDDIETMAWELETKMMEIRKDPRGTHRRIGQDLVDNAC